MSIDLNSAEEILERRKFCAKLSVLWVGFPDMWTKPVDVAALYLADAWFDCLLYTSYPD
jgi:hypothetical protein